MNRLICLIFAVIVLSSCTVQDKPAVRYSFTEVVDASYTPPNTYEIRYRTTFSNGLTVDRCTQVSREEYEREVEKILENDIKCFTKTNFSERSKLPKCIDVCKHYDPSPYPEHEGKLAICRNPHSCEYLIGCNTLADRNCFEPIEGGINNDQL